MKIEIYTGAYGIWKGHIRLCTVLVKIKRKRKRNMKWKLVHVARILYRILNAEAE